jgi:membrane protein YdbS with pleckstrin-like domain
MVSFFSYQSLLVRILKYGVSIVHALLILSSTGVSPFMKILGFILVLMVASIRMGLDLYVEVEENLSTLVICLIILCVHAIFSVILLKMNWSGLSKKTQHEEQEASNMNELMN